MVFRNLGLTVLKPGQKVTKVSSETHLCLAAYILNGQNPGFHVIKFKLDSFCSLIKLLVAFPALLVVAFNTFNKKNCLLFLNFYKVSSQVQRHSYTLNPDRLFSSMKKKKQTFQCLRMLLASKHFYFTPITWRPLRNLLNDWGATFSRMLW